MRALCLREMLGLAARAGQSSDTGCFEKPLLARVFIGTCLPAEPLKVSENLSGNAQAPRRA